MPFRECTSSVMMRYSQVDSTAELGGELSRHFSRIKLVLGTKGAGVTCVSAFGEEGITADFAFLKCSFGIHALGGFGNRLCQGYVPNTSGTTVHGVARAVGG